MRKGCFKNVSMMFCFLIFLLHVSHRSYPSRRRACFSRGKNRITPLKKSKFFLVHSLVTKLNLLSDSNFTGKVGYRQTDFTTSLAYMEQVSPQGHRAQNPCCEKCSHRSCWNTLMLCSYNSCGNNISTRFVAEYFPQA